jgi:tetratricopeptide (TPR) repeat protein
MRYRYAGMIPDLEQAVRYGKEALALCGAAEILCPETLIFVADTLRFHAEQEWNEEQWRTAEAMYEEALPSCAIGHPLHPKVLRGLGFVHLKRYELTGDERDNFKAIEYMRQALNSVQDSCTHEEHIYAGILSSPILQRFHISGDTQYLDEASSLQRRALDLCPPNHLELEIHLCRRSYTLMDYFKAYGQLKDLDEALKLGRRALAIGHPEGYMRRHSLQSVANLLQLRFMSAEATDSDLSEFVELRRESVRLCPPGHNRYFSYLCSLATSFCLRFEWNGSMGDLDEAIEVYRRAIELVSHTDPHRYIPCMDLARCVYLRFKEIGNLEDIHEAARLARLAAKIVSSSDVGCRYYLDDAVSILCLRFERIHEANDLRDAISISKLSFETLPEDHHDRPRFAQRLADALLLRSQREDNLEDALQASALLHSHVDQKFLDSSFGCQYLRGLYTAHLIAFRQGGKSEDAICARDFMIDALGRVSDGRGERFQCLVDLAVIYMERGTPFYDLATSLLYLSRSAADEHRDVRYRLRTTVEFLQKLEVHLAALDVVDANLRTQVLEIYSAMIALLPRVAFFGIDLPSRLQSLIIGQAIATIGASHALQLGLGERAIEMLEHGRAVLWAHSLRLRSEFDDVPAELRRDLLVLSRQLEHGSISRNQQALDKTTIESESKRRRQQSEAFQALVKHTRTIPGLERFMLHENFTALAQAAAYGPVVVLVPGISTSHAVIIQSCSAPQSIRLSSITQQCLVELGTAWKTVIHNSRVTMRETRLQITKKKERRTAAAKADSERVLGILWTGIVLPVLQSLGFSVSCD